MRAVTIYFTDDLFVSMLDSLPSDHRLVANNVTYNRINDFRGPRSELDINVVIERIPEEKE